MAQIFMAREVLYRCTCGAQRPITRIYFCRHCSQLRCGECVSHEVDSHYCQNCLEYMPSPEARLKRNKCGNCFDCPSCMHTLSARATNILVPSADDPEKTMPKKVYYMVCGFCRWTSREVGIPDQITATGSWQEKENPDSSRIYALMEHYRLIAQDEKLEKERKKLSQRSNYLHYADKYGISTVIAKKLAGINISSTFSKDDPKSGEKFEIPEASLEVEILPEKYYSESVNLTSVCTIKQRLFQPQFQPAETRDLHPQQKYLLIKRSQRCKKCEHNLSKPEYNPASIKFKIQLAAFFHIPDLRIKAIPPLLIEKESKVEVTICNPTPHVIQLSFLPLENEEQANEFSKVMLPPCEFTLTGRDDTAEFDDDIDKQQYADDANIVTFRKSNKIGIYLPVIPQKPGEVLISFRMKHNFINTVVQLQGDPREPQEVLLTHELRLNLGKTVSRET